jgi:hypothetical protein
MIGETAWMASRILADWSSWFFVDASSFDGSLSSEDMLSLEADTVESVVVAE